MSDEREFKWDPWSAGFVGLLTVGAAVGQNFRPTSLTWLFWGAAAVVAVIGWRRYHSDGGQTLLPDLDAKSPEVRPSSVATTSDKRPDPSIVVECSPGTRSWDGKIAHSANLTVRNGGEPFDLVVDVRAVGLAAGLMSTGDTEWSYLTRSVQGGLGKTVYCVATLESTTTATGPTWLVKLRGEGMDTVGRWNGPGPFWVELEWTFNQDHRGTLRHLAVSRVRVDLAADEKSFRVSCTTTVSAAGRA